MKHLNTYNTFILEQSSTSDFVHYVVNPSTKEVIIRNDTIGSNQELNVELQPLSSILEKMKVKDKVEFAMNCALFESNGQNVGAYNFMGKKVIGVNSQTTGNFGMHEFAPGGKRNGVLYTSSKGKGTWDIVPTEEWNGSGYYAVQNGPILILDGQINPKFGKESTNLQSYRNGIGIDKSGNLHFALALKPTNFYDFSNFLLEQGCTKAIFCDANVSQAYIGGSVKGSNSPIGPIIMVIN
jgi:uncharacterized protein YigE (DUF2233 family)